MGRTVSSISRTSRCSAARKKLSTGRIRCVSNILRGICGAGFTIPCAVFALALTCSRSGPAHAEAVDLELVFAADGSGSIDDDELYLQRKGYADALIDPRVVDAVNSGRTGKIVVTYIEWGDPSSQHIIVDWTEIAGVEDARAFGEALLAAPRAAWGYNSISEAIAFSTDRIVENAYDGARLVIDVSGDGPQIGGRPIDWARDRAVDAGITVNALAVKSRGRNRPGPGGMPLEMHYRLDIIGGVGAFVMVADEKTPFAEVLLAKIIREIADARPTGAGRSLAGVGRRDDPHQYSADLTTCEAKDDERTGPDAGCQWTKMSAAGPEGPKGDQRP
ncbi:DUF1194 domain-containing protein [Nisaea acidiphila]|uniref:DUF1194 domain-containing protein n=1 Tax=Nisaea acidiphila TaxID=1862145 RepID=A0A9J7B0M6_9PROT|nr:DUF1194 domain-containing protein [Nisaea acidiphila]UUX51237.1 DUF1194 domain-containing protein [Nisaea acidiphila]